MGAKRFEKIKNTLISNRAEDKGYGMSVENEHFATKEYAVYTLSQN
ncbi:MAG: hypothetical protein FWD92_00795 [Methanomassiliicoccaceae archaeon]|nr:hypothetical protein [Methanomassiliicoccaceae archaeon]